MSTAKKPFPLTFDSRSNRPNIIVGECGYTGSQSVYWSGLSEIAVNFDGIRSLNPTVLMGLNAWQSEIFKVFTYLSFPRKRPFCTLIKLRRRTAKNSIAKFPIILGLYTVRMSWSTYTDTYFASRFGLYNFLAFALSSDWLVWGYFVRLSLLIG